MGERVEKREKSGRTHFVQFLLHIVTSGFYSFIWDIE